MQIKNQISLISKIICEIVFLGTLFSFSAESLPVVQAQTEICSDGWLHSTSLDGVNLQLCLPFSSDHSSIAEKNDWVQSGSWIVMNPYQELSVYAIPYGITPAADNLPVSSPGISGVYRDATLDVYKSDAILMMDGPSISIFGTPVKGATYLLPDQNSFGTNGQRLITEWIAEAGNRIWIVRSISRGDFYESSSRQAALDSLKIILLISQSLENPSTSLEQHFIVPDLSRQSSDLQPLGDLQALGDLPTPSWWNGDCDVNNFPGSYALGGVYRGVKACGPLNTAREVNFGVGVHQLEWQCAELPKRYLFLLYGIAPKSADGINVVNVYDNAVSNLRKVANGTPNSGLAAGDILSYNGPTSAGHTAIISSVTIDANGNGTYSTIEQNSSAGGARTNTISNWWLNSNSGISVYLHDSNGSGGGSLNPPNLQSPNAGQTLTSRSVHFTWQSPNATNQNGYTFRLSTNSNPDTQPWLVDTGLGNNYLSYDYNFSSDGTFYWHMRTWNTSNQASSWVTRSFVINTSSSCPSVSGEVRLYDNINCGGSYVTANSTGLWSLASNFNDRAESIAIPGGWSARLYQNDNENISESACFSSTDSNLNDNTFANGGQVGGNATWMRVYDNSSCIVNPDAPSLVSPGNNTTVGRYDSVTLDWNTANGATQYYAEFWGGPNFNLNSGWTTSTDYFVGSSFWGGPYQWRVKSRNSNNVESGWSETRTLYRKYGTPSSLTSSGISQTQVTLSWGASADAPGNIDGYRIYRGGTAIITVGSSTLSYTDTGLGCATGYSYIVKAYKGSLESDASNTVNVTTQTCPPSGIDSYEPDNSFGQAKVINSGSSQIHSIVPATDVDWVKFTLNASSAVTLETTGASSSDTRMWLYDASVNQVDYSDDEGVGNYSFLDRQCDVDALPAGTYYVKIDEYSNNDEIPNYQISLNTTPCIPANAGTWYIYEVGGYIFGESDDIPVPADYNGDGKDDIAIFRPSTSTWYIYGVGPFTYGTVGDIPVVADYNGDGKDDIAVFRPTNSTWYIYGVGPRVYGTVGDIPVVADYNGDGKDDIAVFRPTNSTWYIYGVGPFVYGTVGDIPVVADYNSDGKADIAVFRPSNSTWYIYGVGPSVYGTVNDVPVVADYNGDGIADIAVFRPSNSTWYIRGVGPSVYGTVGDIPVVADYNGDGKADIAVFRP